MKRLSHGQPLFQQNPSDEQRAALQRKYAIRVEEKGNRNNTVWCFLALKLDSTILMTKRNDCVNAHEMSDGEANWKCV